MKQDIVLKKKKDKDGLDALSNPSSPSQASLSLNEPISPAGAIDRSRFLDEIKGDKAFEEIETAGKREVRRGALEGTRQEVSRPTLLNRGKEAGGRKVQSPRERIDVFTGLPYLETLLDKVITFVANLLKKLELALIGRGGMHTPLQNQPVVEAKKKGLKKGRKAFRVGEGVFAEEELEEEKGEEV